MAGYESLENNNDGSYGSDQGEDYTDATEKTNFETAVFEDEGEFGDDLTVKSSSFLSLIAKIKTSPYFKGQTLPGMLFNLTNSTIGAGILALPFTIRSTGLIAGVFFLVFIGVMCTITLDFLLKTARAKNQYSYKALGKAVFPSSKVMPIIFELVIMVHGFGVCVGYFVLLTQLLPRLITDMFGPSLFSNGAFTAGIFMVTILLPLSSMKKIAILSYSSFLSLASAAFVCIVVYAKFATTLFSGNINFATLNYLPPDVLSFVTGFPILFFAYGGHVTILPMYKERVSKNIFPLQIVVVLMVFIAMTTYGSVGIAGYLDLRENVQDNILDSYSGKDISVALGQVLIAVVIMFSFPLMHYVVRDGIENIFFSTKPFSWPRWIIETLVIHAAIYILGILFPQITIVFGLVGATTGVLSKFVFPPLMYLRITTSWKQRIVPIFIMIVSVILGITGAVGIIIKTINRIQNEF